MKKTYSALPASMKNMEMYGFHWMEFVLSIPSPLYIITSYKSNGLSNPQRMTVGEPDLKRLERRMADHKLLGPDMVGQAVAYGPGISLEFLGDGQPGRRSGVGQGRVEQVKGDPVGLIFDFQAFGQGLDGSLG